MLSVKNVTAMALMMASPRPHVQNAVVRGMFIHAKGSLQWKRRVQNAMVWGAKLIKSAANVAAWAQYTNQERWT